MNGTAISLFSGAGGACNGLLDAGCDLLASFERNDDAVATLRLNGLAAIQADLNGYDWSSWHDRVDIVEGGPPCQPFSAAGRHKGKWDDRDCIPAFIDAVAAIMPRVFVMENVRGLTYKKHAEYLATVIKRFRELDYEVDYRVLNAADFGVPQTRQRLFVVGRRDYGAQPRWPKPTHSKNGTDGLLPWVTMATAIATSQWEVTWPHERPATTIAAGAAGRVGRPGHKDWDNGESQFQEQTVKVTPEEAALLQDFRPEWRFVGSRSSIFRQIGNACPRRLTQAVVGAQLGTWPILVEDEMLAAA